MEQLSPHNFGGMTQAAVDLVRTICEAYPHLKLIMNRGYVLLPQNASDGLRENQANGPSRSDRRPEYTVHRRRRIRVSSQSSFALGVPPGGSFKQGINPPVGLRLNIILILWPWAVVAAASDLADRLAALEPHDVRTG